MPITLLCPGCKTRLTLGADRAGTTLDCPRCATAISVPVGSSVPHSPAPATSDRSVPAPRPTPHAIDYVPELRPPLPPAPPPPEPLPGPTHRGRDADHTGASTRPPRSRRGPDARTRLLLKLAAVAVLGAGAFVAVRAAVLKVADGPGPKPAASAQPLSGEQVYQRLIRCTVLIVREGGVGSGFVVDADKRLVVTNFHVVGHARRVATVFPLYDSQGELVTDASRYEPRASELAVQGEVLAVSEERDLALLRVERLSGHAAAVPLARLPAATGSVVYSVGGSGVSDNLL